MASLIRGHEFEQAPGVGDGQGSLVCCSSWGCKELDMTFVFLVFVSVATCWILAFSSGMQTLSCSMWDLIP